MGQGQSLAIPRLPVFGWSALAGEREAFIPCLLDHPRQVFTSSGRAAAFHALGLAGIGAGSRVLVPTYHCPTMVAPIAARGAEAVFYGLDGAGRPCLPPPEAARAEGIRALVVAHYFGLPQAMAPVRAWCDRAGVALIEDCAHAMFGCADGRPCGAWGDFAIGSLPKFFPVPEGGCLIRNQAGPAAPELAPAGLGAELRAGLEILAAGAEHGRLEGLNGLIRFVLNRRRGSRGKGGSGGEVGGEGGRAGAAAGHSLGPTGQRPRLVSLWLARHAPRQRIVSLRRKNYQALAVALAGLPGCRPLAPELPVDCAPYVFPLWVDEPDPAYRQLKEQGLPVFRWNRLWPGTPSLDGDHGQLWSQHLFQLACHQDLDDGHVDAMAMAVMAACR